MNEINRQGYAKQKATMINREVLSWPPTFFVMKYWPRMSTRVRLYASGRCLSICIERGMSVCYTGETIIVVSLSRFKRRHIRWDVAATASSVPNKREKFKVGRHYEDARDTRKYQNFSSFRHFLFDFWNKYLLLTFPSEMKIQLVTIVLTINFLNQHSSFIFFKSMGI